MAAPLMDKVLPPIVFLIGLMTAFLLIVVEMNPTIESNLQNSNNAPNQPGVPDFERLLFSNETWSWFSPQSFSVDSSMRVLNYPATLDSQKAVKFTNPSESSHPISLWVIAKHLGDIGSTDRHQLLFKQSGGDLGLKTYYCIVDKDSYNILAVNGSMVSAFSVNVMLRHNYVAIITPGPGSTDAYVSFMTYNFNVSVGYRVGNMSTDPWSIAAQLFTFSLPGVPLIINALIMVPILVTVGVVAYIVVRSVLPF
jgi:hypothetical protein